MNQLLQGVPGRGAHRIDLAKAILLSDPTERKIFVRSVIGNYELLGLKLSDVDRVIAEYDANRQKRTA